MDWITGRCHTVAKTVKQFLVELCRTWLLGWWLVGWDIPEGLKTWYSMARDSESNDSL